MFKYYMILASVLNRFLFSLMLMLPNVFNIGTCIRFRHIRVHSYTNLNVRISKQFQVYYIEHWTAELIRTSHGRYVIWWFVRFIMHIHLTGEWDWCAVNLQYAMTGEWWMLFSFIQTHSVTDKPCLHQLETSDSEAFIATEFQLDFRRGSFQFQTHFATQYSLKYIQKILIPYTNIEV